MLDAAEISARWLESCTGEAGAAAQRWPSAASLQLVTALQEVLSGSRSDEVDGQALVSLDAATRAWTAESGPVRVVVLRLGVLRHVLADEVGRSSPDSSVMVSDLLDRMTIVANEAASANLRDAALSDPLTGIGNRRALAQHARAVFERCAAAHEPVAVAVIDLDGLKTINDTRGHEAGDAAIVQLASAIRGALRPEDRLFRIGGDEFVALLPGLSRAACAGLMARAENIPSPSFTWGAADTFDGGTLEELQRAADTRLYEKRKSPSRAGAPVAGTPAARGNPALAVLSRTRPGELLAVAALAEVAGWIIRGVMGGTYICGSGGCGLIDAVQAAGVAAIILGAVLLVAGIVSALVRRREA